MSQSQPNAPFPETADIETSSDDYAARFSGQTGAWLLRVQEEITFSLLDAKVPENVRIDAAGPSRVEGRLSGAPQAAALQKGPAHCGKGDNSGAVLDVGGGHGQLARPLCAAGYPVTVLGSAAVCSRRIQDLIDAGQCRFQVGNVLALPFPDHSFDTVLSFRLLPHCERWPELIAELCRVSRGAVIVDYPVKAGVNLFAPLLFGAKKKIERNTRTWRQFSHREVREEFQRHGFRQTGRKGQFFLPIVLHRALGNGRLSASLEQACRWAGLTGLWGSPVILRMERTPAA